MKFPQGHLAYCTNIHPAETWEETFYALKNHTIKVRDQIAQDQAYAIGLRLSAIAAEELLEADHLELFKRWLDAKNCYVFTINGFPYGAFHGTRVKEQVYRPDWTSQQRLTYTKNLFNIIAQLVPEGIDGSVSTLPASFKDFHADEVAMFKNLELCAEYIEKLSETYQRDLHLGMEPEPLGHFENTVETLAFFQRLLSQVSNPDIVRRRIGINYDTCHFALEFNDCFQSLNNFHEANLRISKIHLSSALTLDTSCSEAASTLEQFDEPTYLHQVITQNEEGKLTRFKDIPDFTSQPTTSREARIHFHIPLYTQPKYPLGSTQQHVKEALAYCKKHPNTCNHFEIETYTWSVLPRDLQINIETQIAQEYTWVLEQ